MTRRRREEVEKTPRTERKCAALRERYPPRRRDAAPVAAGI